MVECNGAVASFLQTRGSIPLVWQQRPDLRYKPPPAAVAGAAHQQVFTLHMEEQLRLYGQQVIVNLVDQKKAEGRLEQQLRATVAAASIEGVEYEPFDFHAECSKMR